MINSSSKFGILLLFLLSRLITSLLGENLRLCGFNSRLDVLNYWALLGAGWDQKSNELLKSAFGFKES